MMRYVIAIAIIIIIVVLYIGTYQMDANTEKPEGCEDLSCKTCKSKECVNRKEI